MGNFLDWFNSRVVIGRYPMPTEIEKFEFDYVINVSDEYIDSCMKAAMKSGKRYFWFPLNECRGDMGLNSIYGALQILYIAEQQNAKVYLHCHAGVNRSQTVGDAYFFMRTGTHRARRGKNNSNGQEVSVGLRPGEEVVESNNRLLSNIDRNHLVGKRTMEKLLLAFQEAFKLDDSMRGGQIDQCKVDANV